MITIKSQDQLESMRKAGKILSDALKLMEEKIKVGMSTYDIDKIGHDYIVSQGAVPSFLNYDGFPGSVCVSIDDEVVHGIPRKTRIIEDGMLVKLDCGAGLNGVHTDAARTVCVGNVSKEKRKLVEVTKQSFFEGVKVIKAGCRLGTLGHVIQSYAESFGFGVVRDLCGHGIGTDVHEDPNIPNYGKEGRGMRLIENMCIAVEPMINLGTYKVMQLDDGWTIVTEDGLASAHYENTMIVLEDGVEIITL
ncbi:MAG: type I methionyl aminopeptidase [Clostridia bacterium]|nr:type I methionyl aminopeptidase [Clostridia bacterium]